VNRLRRNAPAALLLAALIGAWELYVDLGGIDDLLLPAPHAVARALYDDRATIWHNFLPTAEEVILGMALALAVALLTAILVHFVAPLRRAVLPIVAASQAIPIVLIAPLLTVWFGFGLTPKLLVVALVSFFPIVVTTVNALETVDPDLIKLLATFDAGRRETFLHVEMPAALPALLTGAKIAAVIAVIGAYLGEQAAATKGLGYLFSVTLANLEYAEAFAAAAVLSLFAITLFALFAALERRALPWAHPETGDRR
jgi:ABC-type nitrate/sulfonate/bicarbonate transport system permease component